MTSSQAGLRPLQPEKPLSPRTIQDVESGRLESLDAEQILIWAIENFHPRLSLACSFGAPEGLVRFPLAEGELGANPVKWPPELQVSGGP